LVYGYLSKKSERLTMAAITKKDIFDILNEFYGRVIEPEFRAVRNKLDDHDRKFQDLLDHFDKIYTRLERLETEYYSITAGIDRLERRLEKIEGQVSGINERLDKEISLREIIEKEIRDLKDRVATLQGRINELEKRVKTVS
jgi:chromosome segregation ATPase